MKSTVVAILLLACVALVNSGVISARQTNTNINENDNSSDNILYDFLVSIVESGPQGSIPIHKPRPPVVPGYKPKPPTYKPRPPTYKPRPPTYKPRPTTYKPRPSTYKPRPTTYKPWPTTYPPTTTEYYQEKTTRYDSGRPHYTTPVPPTKPCKYCSTHPISDDSGEKPSEFDFDDLFDFKTGKDAKSDQKSNEAMQISSDDVFQSQTNFRKAFSQSETSEMQSARMEFEN